MAHDFSQSEIEAYLDEALPASEMASIERELRADSNLLQEVKRVNGRRDAGLHTIGEIWRRQRASCATREQWGSYLLGVLAVEHVAYLDFHLEQIGCAFCRANLEDLRQQQLELPDATKTRRRKYFQSSAGYLRHDSDTSV